MFDVGAKLGLFYHSHYRDSNFLSNIFSFDVLILGIICTPCPPVMGVIKANMSGPFLSLKQWGIVVEYPLR